MKTLERNKRLKSKNPFKRAWNGVPATKRVSCDGSLFESFFLSIVCHVVGALLIWLLAFLLIFFGITPKLFPTPKPKIKDIEFNIAGQQAHHRHHSRRAAQSSAEPSDTKMPKMSEPAPAPKPTPTVKPEPKNISLPKLFNKTPKSETTNKKSQNTSKSITGKAKKAKSSSSNSHSKSDSSDFSSSMSSLKSMSSGLGGTGTGRHRASGVCASGSSFGSFDGPSGNSSSGNSGFDKNTTKKIISTYDISPYVSELKRNIRWNWRAPKTGGNKRVELFLRIAKDGRVVILNVKRTSEVGEVDNAALNAVKKCYPLNPLPSKYKKNFLDVVFTFDSSSIGSRY